MLGAALLFAAMGAAVKIASASLPNAMLVFARSALGLVVLVPWLVRLGWLNFAVTLALPVLGVWLTADAHGGL